MGAGESGAFQSPLLDPHSSNCGGGQQPAHVRFLGGNFTGGASDPPVIRTCVVASGTALFFPILNGVWASTPAPNAACADILAADPWYGASPSDPEYDLFLEQIVGPVSIDPKNPQGSLSLEIDGARVNGLENAYVFSPVFFDVALPDANLFDAGSGWIASLL